jgi:protein gp37
MAEFSKISWTTHTFNPWIGCTKVSEGCDHCYAENLMDLRYHRVQWDKGNPRSRTKTWGEPLRWNRQAEGLPPGQRPRVFCASLADYLDREVPTAWREELFDLIESCPNLDWLLLTKRIRLAETLLPPKWLDSPLPWVWYGVTMENQRRWDERIDSLKALPAAVRFVSYEPALGSLKMGDAEGIHWVIVGGESNQSEPARPFRLEWTDSVIGQCRDQGIAPFVKQFGSNAHYRGRRYRTKHKAGEDPAEWPEGLRVQEFPGTSYRQPARRPVTKPLF